MGSARPAKQDSSGRYRSPCLECENLDMDKSLCAPRCQRRQAFIDLPCYWSTGSLMERKKPEEARVQGPETKPGPVVPGREAAPALPAATAACLPGRRQAQAGLRRCTKCGEEKELKDFYMKMSYRGDRKSSTWCKECEKKHARERGAARNDGKPKKERLINAPPRRYSSGDFVVLNFTGREEILQKARRIADKEERTIEQQIFFWIRGAVL